MDHIYNYIEHLWITITSFPFVIQVAVFFIIVNFTVATAFYLRMVQIRRIKDRREKIIKSLRPKMIEFFEGVLKSERPMTDSEISESLYTPDYEELYYLQQLEEKSLAQEYVDGGTNQKGYIVDSTFVRKFK